MKLRLFYKGSLTSCNYRCYYCPFACTTSTRAELQQDKNDLQRFIRWIETRQYNKQLSILFTPRGEALIWPYYQQAISYLSHLSQIKAISIQSNLSGTFEGLNTVKRKKFSLWCSYHPSEVQLELFIKKLEQLEKMGIDYSVGAVAKKEDINAIQALKNLLPKNRYLWVNAYKDVVNYYSQEDIQKWEVVDPYFSLNLRDYSSFGKNCMAGRKSFSINGNGDVYPCNMISTKLGNIYQRELISLNPHASCSRNYCDCYIGHINFKPDLMEAIYGKKILGRIILQKHME